MYFKSVLVLILISSTAFCNAIPSASNEIYEARGKKKIALFVYWADIVIKKIFVLKLIYAFVFWLVIHKAGYFLTWFITYLKDTKNEHKHHEHQFYYSPHHHYDYEPSVSYGPAHYNGPYRRHNYGAK